MKVTLVNVFVAILGLTLLVGVLSKPAEASDAGNDGDISLNQENDHDSVSPYQKLVASLKLIDALVNNELNDLELAQLQQQHEEASKSGRGFFDDLLSRKGRLLNKRMKSVALGFGK